MAPRRSSGGGNYVFSSNTCSENGAFDDVESRIFIGCYAVMVLAYFGLLIAFGLIRNKHAAARNILRWPYVGLAMLSYLCGYIADIVIITLNECGSIDSIERIKANIAVSVFNALGDMLLLCGLLVLLAPCLQHLNGSNSKATKIMHSIVLAVVGGLELANVVLSSYKDYHYDDYYNDGSFSLWLAGNKVCAATYIVYTLAVGLGLGICFVSLVQMHAKRIANGSLAVLIVLFGLCMLLWPVLVVVLQVYYELQGHKYTLTGSYIFEYLIDFTQVLAFIFLLLIAKSRAVAAGAGMPQHLEDPIYAPVDGSEYQPVYGGSNSLYQVPPQQSEYQGYGGYQQPPQQQQYAYQGPHSHGHELPK